LLGGDGDNELWGDDLSEQLLLVGGHDQLSSGNGIDVAYGGGGNDIINVGSHDDYAFGGAGNDQIDGMNGDDRLFGGAGDDTISGAAGNDLIAGNGDKDRLYGKSGHDVVIGGDGADIINGDDGNDLLFDANVRYDDPGNPPAGNDASTAEDDANSLAMAELLADWASDFAISAALLAVSHDAFLDSLSGGTGVDTAYRKKAAPHQDSILAVEADLP
jgi:Ca2+-binding RTX toxin-like protein